jgi:hypothetical protein
MASIDLPRALQDYFAFAETTPTRNGRRFCITLPYVRSDGRLDRLQWWYHLSAAKEMALGERAPDALRAEAIDRFSVHIERWLHNTRQELYGDGSIPYVSPQGNRVVAAFRVDPVVSEGLPPNVDDDSVSAESAAMENKATGMDGGDMLEAEGNTTSAESNDLPASKSAFG